MMAQASSLHAAGSEDWAAGGFGMYVHWPFCAAKCPYCDFNSHVSAHIDYAKWEEAYLIEIDRVASEVGDRPLHSIFLGGGTPSLMPPALVEKIIGRIASRFRFRNDIEITLEANPTSADAERFRAFAQGGVNRISLGLQSLDDRSLRLLGRLHTAAEGVRALDAARSAVSRVSFDLIYARQDQSFEMWRAELAEALALTPDHLSLYQLTIEDGTAFGERLRRGTLPGMPDEELSAELYEYTITTCEAEGLSGYEISNFAREGMESVHNLVYWRCGDFAGIGPGAHGRLTLDRTRLATQALTLPVAWMDAVNSRGSGEMPRVLVPVDEQADELLLMGLRLAEGVDLDRYRRVAGHPIGEAAISDLTGSGHLWHRQNRIGATVKGRMVLNSLLAELA